MGFFADVPSYAKIIVDEPPEIRQHANPNYRIIFHTAALVEEALKAIPEGTDADGQVYSKEARQAGEALEEAKKMLFQVVSGEGPEEKPIRSFIDASTSTTNEPRSLDDRMHSLECKLDTLLSKPSYAATLQHPLHPVSSLPAGPVTAPAAKAVSPEETRFVVEVESLVPENFNPLPLRDSLNGLLPKECSKFTAIRRSWKGNLVCYTLGDSTTTIKAFETWAPGIPFGAIQVNAKEKWARRILYLSQPCTSAFLLNTELREFNTELRLATNPQLLTPTVALLLFSTEIEAPQHVFAFATSWRLASYQARTSTEIERAKQSKEVMKQKEKIGEVAEVSWATQMEESEGAGGMEEVVGEPAEELMDETPEN